MKVLYVYSRPRRKIHENYINGNGPNHILHGLSYMKNYSISATFKYDDYHGFIKKVLTPVEKISLLNLSQSIKLIPEMKKNDLIFSTNDGSGLGLSFIKSIFHVKKPHIYQTIGLKYTRFTNLPNHIIVRGSKIYRKILSHVNKIVYVSHAEKEFLTNSLKIPEEKMKYLPFGVDVDYFSPLKSSDKDYILSVGGDLNRDYRTLLEAVKNEDLKLEIVCHENNIKGLSIPKNVSLYFNLNYNVLKNYYSKCKFLIIPSNDVEYSAGQTVLLEGMSMGKAVIVSKSKGLYNSVELEDFKHCIFSKPNDVRDLEEKIQYLMDNPIEIKKIGRNARRIVEKKYNSKNYAEELSKVFWEVYHDN